MRATASTTTVWSGVGARVAISALPRSVSHLYVRWTSVKLETKLRMSKVQTMDQRI